MVIYFLYLCVSSRRELHASSNKLVEVPAEIGKLQRLQVLNLNR